MRSNEARELIRANPFAFILAWVIADRGRYNPSFNKDNLKLGEAMLGDFKMCGMSHRQYRTAVEQLSKWGFATFRKTNKGTIGRLVDARLFSIFRIQADNQNGNRPTIKRQAADKQPTTNKSSKSSKSLKERGEKEQPPPGFWKDGKDLTAIEKLLSIAEGARPRDAEYVRGLKADRALIKERIRERGRANSPLRATEQAAKRNGTHAAEPASEPVDYEKQRAFMADQRQKDGV